MTRLRGRDTELGRIQERFAAGCSVVVLGEAGTGKTSLWRAALEGVERCARVVATETTRSIPLGAFAGLLPRAVGTTDPLARLESAVEDLRADSAGPVVLAVDDAHLLDDVSAAALLAVALHANTTVFATVRCGEPAPDAITRLWKDSIAEQIALGPLDASAAHAVVEDLVGAPVEPQTQARLLAASGGNPFFLRELVHTGLNGRAFRDAGGVRAWAATLRGGPSLETVVQDRLASLTVAVRRCGEVVAVGGTTARMLVETVCSARAVERALDADVVRLREDRGRHLLEVGHPLYGSMLKDALAPEQTHEILERLVTAAEASPSGRPDDDVRIAAWRVALADRSRPDALHAAADRAFNAQEVHFAEWLAQAAIEAGAGDSTTALLGRIQAILGRDSAEPRPIRSNDRAALYHTAMTEADRFLWGHTDSIAALAGLRRAAVHVDDSDRATVAAMELTVSLHAGAPAREIIIAGRALLAEHAGPADVVHISMPLGSALAAAGRTGEALGVFAHARSVAPDADVAPFLYDRLDQSLVEVMLLGGLLHDAERAALAGYNDAVARVEATARMGWAMVRGRVELCRGRPRQAARRFGEALAPAGSLDLVGFRTRSLADVQHALAWSGEAPLGEADVAVPPMGSHGAYFAPWVLVTQAERAACLGRLGDALHLAEHAVERALASEQLLIGALAWHVAARVRPSRIAATSVAQLLRDAEGDLAPLLVASTAALADDEAHTIEECAHDWREIGADSLEVEYLAFAADSYRRHGLGGAERRCRTAALQAEAELEAHVPLAHSAPSVVALTPREREVAALAAAGLTNRAIAERLACSMRTVHAHLHAAYRKLGVNRRHQLAGLLDCERRGVV